ncbi:hypothetical protein GDO81_009014 [Engystomops pustulosus]|uniref:Uncharacterized protein n=1 Tax=Engystomops pustulosus TaxID=76066 RepID=A0AAV7BN33_ENGPU|nr:hypothetical protein GDO81_009014 [Engystomops pustulosus]
MACNLVSGVKKSAPISHSRFQDDLLTFSSVVRGRLWRISGRYTTFPYDASIFLQHGGHRLAAVFLRPPSGERPPTDKTQDENGKQGVKT